ncbi:unnamed protein product [Danaus chrysippus]|uniref:(African queen) hypothetical protein n=1 Tax=Danaus chrysippus TaxID=151541 RepID=A0A8J2W3K3_9NEOP|nr:unnamed protein product [Danaus chrysippus]
MTTNSLIQLPLEVLANIVIHLELNDIRNLMLTFPTVTRNDIRTNDISRFVVRDGVIVCGNRDGNVSVYEVNKDRQKPNLVSHIKNCHENGSIEVSAVERICNTIVTMSQNTPLICFWNFEDYKSHTNNKTYPNWSFPDSMKTIEIPHARGCRCVAVNNSRDKLAIGLNGNSRPVIVDVNMRIPIIHSEETICSQHLTRDIQWHDDNSVVFVSHSGRLQMIDVRSNDLAYETTDPFLSSLFCVKTDSNHAVVVGSAEYSRCVLFDLRSKHHVQMFFTQKKSSCIYSLDFDSTRLIAAADRGVAGLNFNVNPSTTQMRDYSQTFEVIHG